jgi:hypothetical protein
MAFAKLQLSSDQAVSSIVTCRTKQFNKSRRQFKSIYSKTIGLLHHLIRIIRNVQRQLQLLFAVSVKVTALGKRGETVKAEKYILEEFIFQ